MWKLGDFGLMTSDMRDELGHFTNPPPKDSIGHRQSIASTSSSALSNTVQHEDGGKCTKIGNYLQPTSHTIGIGTISVSFFFFYVIYIYLFIYIFINSFIYYHYY